MTSLNSCSACFRSIPQGWGMCDDCHGLIEVADDLCSDKPTTTINDLWLVLGMAEYIVEDGGTLAVWARKLVAIATKYTAGKEQPDFDADAAVDRAAYGAAMLAHIKGTSHQLS